MKTLVVGAGGIAREHLGCLTRLPQVEEVHVCDLSPATARAMADRFGLAGWTTDLEEAMSRVRPDVVHVTTPPSSHFDIARRALEAGSHVIVEKPATLVPGDLATLVAAADDRSLVLVEDYNHVYNPVVQEALHGIAEGTYGDLVHVDISISLDIFSEGSPFLDPALNRSFAAMKGGPIADFLPHLASLAHAFVGAHRSAYTCWTKTGEDVPFPVDGLRAIVEGERATASLGFSGYAQPDLFSVVVEGTRMRSRLNLFETRATHERQLSVPQPLVSVSNGLREGLASGTGSLRSFGAKFSGGPGAYRGLWTLVEQVYAALATGTPPPVTTRQILEVNALVSALTDGIEAA